MSAETERVLALAAELIEASPDLGDSVSGYECARWGRLALWVSQDGTTPDRRGIPLVAGRLVLVTGHGATVGTAWQEIAQDRSTGEYTLLTVREFLRNHSRRLAASLVLTVSGTEAGEVMATILPQVSSPAWNDRRFSVEVKVEEPTLEPRTVILGGES